MSNEDLRCCGTGTCLINAEGVCWCGQRWDGEKMCAPGQHGQPSGQTASAGDQPAPHSAGLVD